MCFRWAARTPRHDFELFQREPRVMSLERSCALGEHLMATWQPEGCSAAPIQEPGQSFARARLTIWAEDERWRTHAGAVFGLSSFVSLNASAQFGWRSCPASSDRALYYSHSRDCGNQTEGACPWHTYSLAGMHR